MCQKSLGHLYLVRKHYKLPNFYHLFQFCLEETCLLNRYTLFYFHAKDCVINIAVPLL